MKTEPLPHQAHAFARFRDATNCALFWTMGRGKTKTAIDLMDYKFQHEQICRVVIVAPNQVPMQWVEEQLPLHCDVPYIAHVYKSKNTQKYLRSLYDFLSAANRDAAYKRLAILAVHVEAFSYDTIMPIIEEFAVSQHTLFIIDEATRIKNPKSKRTKNLMALRRKYGGPSIIMTATALAKRPVNAWALYNFMNPRILNCTYDAFEAEHTVMAAKKFTIANGRQIVKREPIEQFTWDWCKRELRKAPVNSDRILEIAMKLGMTPNDVIFVHEHDEFVRYKNIDKLKKNIAPYTDFITPDMTVDLPPKKYEVITLPLSSEQKRVINDLRRYAIAEQDGAVMTVQSAMALQIKALQVCGGFFPYEDGDRVKAVPLKGNNPKLEWLLEELEEVGDAQFLVFSVFRAEMEMLYERISATLPVGVIHGGITKDKREETVNRFKNRELQGVVCNPYIAGYGLNLQGATVQYWYSRGYATEDRIQAEGRSHRIGTVVSPVYKDIILDAKFEKAVLANNMDGKALNDYFNNATPEQLLAI